MTAPTTTITPETITGEIVSIGFRNSENWSTFKIEVDQLLEYSCTGTLPTMVDIGSEVTVTGQFVNSPKYGQQLKCSSVVPAPPDTKTDAGLCKLLQRVPGIGPAKAQAYLDRCKKEGLDPVETAIQHPEQIPCRPGKEEETSQLIVDLTTFFEHIIYLLGIGLTDNQADKILRKYGAESIRVISENPYIIIDEIQGIGFMLADQIAFKAGIKAGNQARTMACIQYCLKDSQVNNGNTKISGWKLVQIVYDILMDSCQKNRASVVGLPGEDEIRSAVYLLQGDGKVVVDDGWVFDAGLLNCEMLIEENLKI